MSEVLLSKKFRDFLRCRSASVEFLEGTTYAGKTTVGIMKFMFRVAASPKKIHIVSGLDTGTIEKNIINKELGIIDVFGSRVEYNSGGKGQYSLPHIVFRTGAEDKIIYVLGYDNKARWKKALGGQYGCLYIDEINIADMEYVREAAMRCDYLLATLNPDDPNLPVYSEYINRSRPLPEYVDDAPTELLEMLSAPAKPGWVWWYFSFDHNAALEGSGRIHFQLARLGATPVALVDKRHGSFSDLAGAFTMNTTATNEGGWQGCHMRQEILGSDSADVLAPKEGTLLALLPEELRAVMKPCTKYTDNTGNSMEAAAVTATQEWLFLLSEWEYYGARTMANEGEQSFQQQYAYYAAGGSPAKMRHNRTTATARDWCRSPAAGWAGFCHVNKDGTAYYEAPNADLGIAPAFVLGA